MILENVIAAILLVSASVFFGLWQSSIFAGLFLFFITYFIVMYLNERF